MKQMVVLVVLDGWGIGRKDESNPIHVVNPERFRWLSEHYPVTSLQASGISVGLPWGEVGNSEVGHLSLGAGKVIYQYYPRITMAIQDESFFVNRALLSAFAHAETHNSYVHLVGLLSDGNVHAAIEHIHALLEFAKKQGTSRVKLHLFADGKDVPPKTLEKLLSKLPEELFATLTGRYYAMDRDENWNLVRQAYQCLTGTGGTEIPLASLSETIQKNYAKGLSEEFLPPLRIQGEHNALQENDAVVFVNYREDSIREIAESFIAKEFEHFPRTPFENLFITTMTHYRDDFRVPVAFPPDEVTSPLGKTLSDKSLTQLRLAETYKYAHVTYFFNGYKEPPFKGEYRVLIPSQKIPHPAEHPELMASAVTDRLLEAIAGRAFDFVLVNYSNPDTIGHTANYEAAQEVVRIMNNEVEKILNVALNPHTVLIITSDHGNIEEVINPQTGEVESQHDPNPVPFYLIGEQFKERKFANWRNISQETMGILSDVAPTILEIMDIPKPKEMTGKSLLRHLI